MKKYKRVLFTTLIGFILTSTIVASTSTTVVDSVSSSYGHQLVQQLNAAPDPVEFWNMLSHEDQKILAESLVAEIDYKIDVTETTHYTVGGSD